MRYYAHFGHTDFVLCLGYGASAVKDFFLSYDETRSNDFVLENGAQEHQAVQDRHLRLAHHLRRHRPALRHRRAAAPGPAFRRRRGDVPGQLRRRAHRRAAAGHDLAVRRQRRGGQPAGRAAAVVAPRRRDRRDGLVTQVTPGARPPAVGERRLLRAAGPRSSITCTRARTWSKTRWCAWSRSSRPRLPVQGVLVPGRHGEGARTARRDVLPRPLPVDDLGPGALRRSQADRRGCSHRRPGTGLAGSYRSCCRSSFKRRRGRPCRCSRSARTRTTSRLAQAACCSAWPRARLASTTWCSPGPPSGTRRHATRPAPFWPGPTSRSPS